MSRWRIPALVFLLTAVPFCSLHAQILSSGIFWDYPSVFVDSPAGYFQVASNGTDAIVAWQEEIKTGENEGEIYISLKTTADGKNWQEIPRAIGPVTFVGAQVRIYSLVLGDDGTSYLAVSSDKQTIDIYQLLRGELQVRKTVSISLDRTTVAPSIFSRSDGGLLLFATQEVATLDASGRQVLTTSIIYSRSDDGYDWSPVTMFVFDETVKVTLHFLPRHASFGGRDYVVFQSYITDPELRRQTNQLYLKMSDDGGQTWTRAARLTDFSEIAAQTERPAGAFDNENAFLYAARDKIIVTWERRIDSPRPQVYYGELDADGQFIKRPEAVTDSVRSHRSPRAFEYDGRIYLLWFDNRAGSDHIVLASKTGVVWNEFDLSEDMPGISQFGIPYMLGDELYILWQNKSGQDSSIVLLGPDRWAPEPTVVGVNFEAGRRYAQDTYSISWNLPDDSSRIEGF